MNTKASFDMALDGSYNLLDTNILPTPIMGNNFRQNPNAYLLRGR